MLHAVVATVTTPGVPAITPEVPTEALEPVAITILFPAVASDKLPFVAVIFPSVAVKVVVAVSDPVTAVFPVALPILVAPVPPVPIVVIAAPEILMLVVPTMLVAASVLKAVTPRVVLTVTGPVIAVPPVAFPMFVAPVPPVPIVVIPDPELLMFTAPRRVVPTNVAVPVTVRLVNAPVFGVTEPIGGGVVRFVFNVNGVTILLFTVPVLTSACVARAALPATEVVAAGTFPPTSESLTIPATVAVALRPS